MAGSGVLDYLYSLEKFGIKLGLDNIRALLEALDNPQRRYAVIHVAGTNGKGSVCAFLGAILRQGGYRVGVYTSPHLRRFNERICVNDRQISDDDLEELVTRLRRLGGGVPATFFEFTTAVALEHFARQRVDIAVVETGMGGRLDATNVVEPLVTVITTISHDHDDYLGDSLSMIAAEKGGIIKQGVPVVLAPQPAEAQEVLEDISGRHGCRLCCYGRDYSVVGAGDASVDITVGTERWIRLQPALEGEHQQINLAVAMAALAELPQDRFPVARRAVCDGVRNVFWPGRLQRVCYKGVQVLLDGAHNGAGAAALAAYLARVVQRRIHLVCGFKYDKDVSAIMAELAPMAVAVYAVEPPVELACPGHKVVALAGNYGRRGSSYARLEAALDAAVASAGADEMVVVAGSLFLVAAASEYLAL
ncbi:MAG: hypothetical protein B6I36_08460 [Desulfobacteraceae bacterium 4572_35.1]|nr:MAG: hypothetical protein B6I36_08460 [Desulfobacteraceae bacterium 4572_35.1]